MLQPPSPRRRNKKKKKKNCLQPPLTNRQPSAHLRNTRYDLRRTAWRGDRRIYLDRCTVQSNRNFSKIGKPGPEIWLRGMTHWGLKRGTSLYIYTVTCRKGLDCSCLLWEGESESWVHGIQFAAHTGTMHLGGSILLVASPLFFHFLYYMPIFILISFGKFKFMN